MRLRRLKDARIWIEVSECGVPAFESPFVDAKERPGQMRRCAHEQLKGGTQPGRAGYGFGEHVRQPACAVHHAASLTLICGCLGLSPICDHRHSGVC
eukprot:6197566-Pleurochrysis_carterae.AAC.1